MKLENWLNCHVHAYEYFGGVTRLLIPDNLKAGVTKNNRYETSGVPQAVPQGMEILRNRGVYLVPGQYSNSGSIEIQPQMITFKALHIIGSSQYSVSDVKAYLDFLCSHTELHEIVKKLSSRYSISDINLAIEDAKSGNNIKTVLIP